ncbi:MAG: transporter substrate-binding protein [Schlesneria sp.]
MKKNEIDVTNGVTRRDCLKQGSGAFALASMRALVPFVFAGCSELIPVSEKKSVKVGILHSQTGLAAMSEIALRDIELMAIEDINAAGGILGAQIDPIVEDGASRATTVFPKRAKTLLSENKVAVVFGCGSSASRKSVLPVFEESNGLLFYPVSYEGNESSRNIIYTGSTPNQQILPAIDWLLSEAGGSRKRIFLVGSDVVRQRTENLIIKKYLQDKSILVVGETYIPLSQKETGIARNIEKASPDAILSTLHGDSNLSFYNEWAAAGVTADQVPVVSTNVGEDELRRMRSDNVNGHFSARSYFQSLNTDANKKFINRFQQEHGYDRITDESIEAAYSSVYLWKAAVEKAESFDVDKVREALRSGIKFDGPGGELRIDPKTQHAYKRFRLGRVGKSRQFEIVYQSEESIAPDPYPQSVFPGWSCDWTNGGVKKGAEVKID